MHGIYSCSSVWKLVCDPYKQTWTYTNAKERYKISTSLKTSQSCFAPLSAGKNRYLEEMFSNMESKEKTHIALLQRRSNFCWTSLSESQMHIITSNTLLRIPHRHHHSTRRRPPHNPSPEQPDPRGPRRIRPPPCPRRHTSAQTHAWRT